MLNIEDIIYSKNFKRKKDIFKELELIVSFLEKNGFKKDEDLIFLSSTKWKGKMVYLFSLKDIPEEFFLIFKKWEVSNLDWEEKFHCNPLEYEPKPRWEKNHGVVLYGIGCNEFVKCYNCSLGMLVINIENTDYCGNTSSKYECPNCKKTMWLRD